MTELQNVAVGLPILLLLAGVTLAGDPADYNCLSKIARDQLAEINHFNSLVEAGCKPLATPKLRTLSEAEAWIEEHPVAAKFQNQLVRDPGTNNFLIMQGPLDDMPQMRKLRLPDGSTMEMLVGQDPLPQQDDEKILDNVSDAHHQADSWADAFESQLGIEILSEVAVGKGQKAGRIFCQIYDDRENEQNWEKTVWTVPYSELLPGEYIAHHLGTFVLIAGTGGKRRVVSAPLQIRAHVLMERLRHAISHYTAIHDFIGEPRIEALTSGWNSAWFDARNVYCRLSPGAKYYDLSNEEHVCQ